MTVALPTNPPAAEAITPRFLFWGGEQVSPIGGPTTLIERPGSRFSIDVDLPPLTVAQAMVWIARLIRGLGDGSVSIKWPQPGFTPNGNATGAIKTAVSGGTTIALKGLLASVQTIKEGQFFSIIHDGRRYLHFNAGSDGAANGSGELTLTIEPPLRAPVSVDDVVEIGTPTIEGYLKGNQREWTVDLARTYGLSFTIEEIE